MSLISSVFLGSSVVTILFMAFYLQKKHIYRWLPQYLHRAFRRRYRPGKTIDIMVLFVDHFELDGNADRLRSWTEHYPEIARRHVDSDGRNPVHTMFYALDLIHEQELVALRPLVKTGLAEIELHWHHAYDTEHSFRQKLLAGLEIFQEYGYMRPMDSSKYACFSFIHGNWSLANSIGSEFCGVDNELRILKELGCYADFTFPALFSTAQPPSTGGIFYTAELDSRAGYFSSRESSLGAPEKEHEFMLFQGLLSINWRHWHHAWHPTIEDGNIDAGRTQNHPERIECWVREGLSVVGRPEWLFIKLFCHGAQDHQAVVGAETDAMFSYLESHYNDGTSYRLHYVSAREAYNIVRAAEDGFQGNAGHCRDYIISHPELRDSELKQQSSS